MSAYRSAGSRSWQRPRSVVAGLLILAVAVGYALAISYADRERAQLRASVATLTAEAYLLEQQALELERLRRVPEPASSARALRERVESAARGAGFAKDAYTLEAIGTDEVRIAMGSIDFAAWLKWVERLQAQQIRLRSARIEPLSRPGLVSTNAVFVHGR